MLWGALALLTLAVARITRLIVSDEILLSFRRWVVNKYGEESKQALLVHCVWCVSIWVAFPAAIIWALLLLPWQLWWLFVPAALAMSHVTSLLSRLEER
jgi:hypothetical protein